MWVYIYFITDDTSNNVDWFEAKIHALIHNLVAIIKIKIKSHTIN